MRRSIRGNRDLLEHADIADRPRIDLPGAPLSLIAVLHTSRCPRGPPGGPIGRKGVLPRSPAGVAQDPERGSRGCGHSVSPPAQSRRYLSMPRGEIAPTCRHAQIIRIHGTTLTSRPLA
jgi:hypothetical protein